MSGNLYIVAAPSGAGKTSLVNALLANDPDIALSISYTTRQPRPGEQDHREYHFVQQAEFRAMIARGEFLEHAEVFGNLYGTSATWIGEQTQHGRDIVLEIDWQGAQQVKRLKPDAIGIFVLPPSMQELENRLRKRGQDSDAVIQRRLADAKSEIAHVGDFEYVIINKDFDIALADLAAIVRASRLRLARQRQRHPEWFDSP
jgi:guanylate kinase